MKRFGVWVFVYIGGLDQIGTQVAILVNLDVLL